MNAWWQFIQILATAKKLSMSSGYSMEMCVKLINDVFVAYEAKGDVKLGSAGLENTGV